ncbi:MAG: hypothetical protein IPJ65_32055 [Archangiaceae bacterium]|nr:hypothetical protein [Archangiaceae bacterium]
MSFLYQAHSGLRYVVLLVGLTLIAMCFAGLMQKQPFTRPGRVVGSIFAGCLHLQVLIGVAVAAMGLWQKRDIGHVAMMVPAVVLAQVMLSKNRRSASPNWVRPLIGVGGALVLISAGLFAIGRMPWGSTAF